MIPLDEIKVTSSGSNYVVGEMGKQHKDLNYLQSGSLVCLFDGLDTLLNTVVEKMPKPKNGKSSVSTERDDFNAFGSYDEALDVFRNKPETVVKFDPGELRIKDESESGSRVDYDVTGDYIDMGRYMEGVPESVGTMHNGNARNRRVNIMIDLGQWWGLKPDVIIHRGERILRLVDALEAGGVRTRLVGVESNECSHTEVVLKRHEEPLTISDLAVVSHPEFLRRVIFRINEYSKTWEWGYGTATILNKRLRPEMLLSDNNDETNIYIGSSIKEKEAVDKLFDQLEKLLVWEMSKPVPEIVSIKLSEEGIYFEPNGARDNAEIKREGQEVINEKG